jgi:polygalacturonase
MSLKRLLGVTALIAGSLITHAQSTQYSWQNLPRISLPSFKKDTFNIAHYGAKPNGVTLNTESINKAITDCSVKGGGVVLVTQGLWLTGPLVLKSNVNLHIDRAALLQFTDDKSQYPLVEGNFEGHAAVRNQSPISGTDLENIAITGEGIIDGHGEAWRAISKTRLTDAEWQRLVSSGGVSDAKTWYPSAGYIEGSKTPAAGVILPGKSLKDYESIKDFLRPNMLVLTNCKKFLLQDVTFQNSPAWCLHPLLCQDLTLKAVHVRNLWNAQNGDGIDVESCRNVMIEGSTFDAGDDGICIKSGRDAEGRRRGVPTENVIVKNDVVYRAHGGFVIGSEMSGGARNIFVSDCTFIGTDIGMRFKTTRGRGGMVENIHIRNINMRDIVHEAILFDMYYVAKPPATSEPVKDEEIIPVTETTPQFRNFYLDNVVCDGAEKAIMIRGLPEMSIKGIHLENMVLKTERGVDIIEGQGITLKNIQLETKETSPLINIENSSDLVFNRVTYSSAQLLFKVGGKKSAHIRFSEIDASKAKKMSEFKSGAESISLVADK